jgi:hypothetical protein
MRDEATGDWRKLDSEEFRILYSMIKLMRMGWLGHIVHMGEIRNASKNFLESLKGRYHVEHLRIGGRIILKWI